jgi:hypothetical protein
MKFPNRHSAQTLCYGDIAQRLLDMIYRIDMMDGMEWRTVKIAAGTSIRILFIQ